MPDLTDSILISNRIDTIRKCMESIKPLLTGFPCELIAVDTVGEATDGSIDVVREVKEFSAYIHHYGYVFETEEERQAHSKRK